jgi:hypothetical protein
MWSVETEPGRVGCPVRGVIARSKDRRGVTVRDAPAADRVAALEATPASLARELGVTWSTAWRQIERHGRDRVDDAGRVGPVAQVGFDETVMSPAKRHRRRRFIA